MKRLRSKLRPNTSDNERLISPSRTRVTGQQTPPSEFRSTGHKGPLVYTPFLSHNAAKLFIRVLDTPVYTLTFFSHF